MFSPWTMNEDECGVGIKKKIQLRHNIIVDSLSFLQKQFEILMVKNRMARIDEPSMKWNKC